MEGFDFITYKICRRCSKMFEKNKELYCKSCTKRNETEYELIASHLRQNPGATIMEVISATGVTLKGVNCFIDDGSIAYVGSSAGTQQRRISLLDKTDN